MISVIPAKKAVSETGHEPEENVRRYFRDVTRRYYLSAEPCVFLPSLMSLTAQLGCSAVLIQAVLNELWEQGYDYFMMDMHSPITLWHPSQVTLE